MTTLRFKPPREKKCRACRKEFTPRRPLQSACSAECAYEVGKLAHAKKVRRERLAERKVDMVRLEQLKTVPTLTREAQREFNRWVRFRDEGKPCICCGAAASGSDVLRGHGVDAGHYRSTGSAPHLRFNEDNCHAQRVLCNRYGGGRAVDYRLGLIARIGLARVEALENDNGTHKWTRDELRAIRDTYKAKWRELAKAQARKEAA